MSSYSLSKLAVIHFTASLKAEYPDITSVSINPDVVPTDMGVSAAFLAPFMKDTAELSAGAAVWLSSGDKSFLSGRCVAANWDVEELEARKEELIQSNLLTIYLSWREVWRVVCLLVAIAVDLVFSIIHEHYEYHGAEIRFNSLS